MLMASSDANLIVRSPSTRLANLSPQPPWAVEEDIALCEARTIGLGRFGLRLPSDGDSAQTAICASSRYGSHSPFGRLETGAIHNHRPQAATPPATAARLPVVPSFTHGQQTFHRPHEGRPAKSLQFRGRVERVAHNCAYRCALEVTPCEGPCASTAVELTEKWPWTAGASRRRCWRVVCPFVRAS